MVIDGYTTETNLTDKGVYLISHKDTNLLYVGSTYQKEGFRGRWRQHLLCIRKGKGNVVLCNIYKKYGLEGFKFSILERMNNCSEKEIREREAYYINLYDSYHNGANVSLSTDCSLRVRKHFPNTPEKCQLYKDTSTTKKPMYVYDGEGNLVYTFESGVDADRFFGLKKGAASDKARMGWSYYSKFWFSRELKEWKPLQTKMEHVWKGSMSAAEARAKRGYKPRPRVGFHISEEQKIKERLSNPTRLKVSLYSLDGTFFRSFESLNECDDFFGISRGTTSKVIKHKNHAKTIRKKYIPKLYANTVLTE